MSGGFDVTYETWTEDCMEAGDTDERGFWAEGISLREAVRMVGHVQDCGTWFAETVGDTDYTTGAVTYRSLHPPHNITKASYGRLKRLLKA